VRHARVFLAILITTVLVLGAGGLEAQEVESIPMATDGSEGDTRDDSANFIVEATERLMAALGNLIEWLWTLLESDLARMLLLLSVPVAYALARMRFRENKALFDGWCLHDFVIVAAVFLIGASLTL